MEKNAFKKREDMRQSLKSADICMCSFVEKDIEIYFSRGLLSSTF